jgi:hypothetical protein
MGKVIDNPKDYSGKELEQIFFRPALTGPGAAELGIKVLYNMPVPTKMNFWKRAINVLKVYAKGWTGGDDADKYQKEISLSKVKAELGIAADDYFGMVYELITNTPNVNLDDIQGTDIEKAETQLFREAIQEDIRAHMWLGKVGRSSGKFAAFNGFLTRIIADSIAGTGEETTIITLPDMSVDDAAEGLFKTMYRNCGELMQQFKDNLTFYVTTDVLNNYEDTLASANLESSRTAMINGIKEFFYSGIPVKPVKIQTYLPNALDLPQSFVVLSVKDNLNLAVNTNAFPGMEARMWYNPDAMENRQRCIFMAGCDYLMPELIRTAVLVATPATPTVKVAADNTTVTIEWTASAQTSIYNVYQNGTKIATVTTNSKAITGLTANTTYKYKVSAVIGGAESALSGELSVTTTNV